jgi:hypothetical protein
VFLILSFLEILAERRQKSISVEWGRIKVMKSSRTVAECWPQYKLKYNCITWSVWLYHTSTENVCMYKRKIEERSRSYCYCGKAIIITYSECVSVALVIQHEMRKCRFLLPSATSLVLPRFFTLFHKRHDFLK